MTLTNYERFQFIREGITIAPPTGNWSLSTAPESAPGPLVMELGRKCARLHVPLPTDGRADEVIEKDFVRRAAKVRAASIWASRYRWIISTASLTRSKARCRPSACN